MLTKTKFWQFAAVFLLLLNLSQVFFHMRRPDGNALKNKVVKILQLDAAQTADYEKLIEQHRRDIQAKESVMSEARRQLYALLSGDDFSAKDSLVQQIGMVQAEIEQIHLSHFQALKALCRPEQKAGFQQISREMLRFLSPKRKPGDPRQ